MTDKPLSLLQQVRADGYRDGWRQASQVRSDDAYARGRLDAQREAPIPFLWFCSGAATASFICIGMLG